MNNYNFYFKNEYQNNENLEVEPTGDTELDSLLRDAREALIAKDYFSAFMGYEKAIRLNNENFEARLGEYKAWYLYSAGCKHRDKWDYMIDDLYRSVLFVTLDEYKEQVVSMYKEDKKNYPLTEGK